MSGRACNLCLYERLKREAKKTRRKLRIVNDDGWFVVQSAKIGGTRWQRHPSRMAFMAIGNKCEC